MAHPANSIHRLNGAFVGSSGHCVSILSKWQLATTVVQVSHRGRQLQTEAADGTSRSGPSAKLQLLTFSDVIVAPVSGRGPSRLPNWPAVDQARPFR